MVSSAPPMYKRYQMDLGIATADQQKASSKRDSHLDALVDRKRNELKKVQAELEKVLQEKDEKKAAFLVVVTCQYGRQRQIL